MAPKFHTLQISEIERFGDFAVALRFDVPDDLAAAYTFLPGQYLTLKTDIDGVETRRPYSICTAPDEDGIGVGIKHVDGGAFSTYALDHFAVGDNVEVMTPQGRFTFDQDIMAGAPDGALGGASDGAPGGLTGRHFLLLAAGSGITPILAIAKTMLATGSAHDRITLVYGNRSSTSIMFRDVVEDLKDRYLDRFRLIHVLSREMRDVDLLNGRVDAEKIAALCESGLIVPADIDAAFLCGPDSMITDCSAALVAAGMAEDRIAHEKFIAAVPPGARPAAAARRHKAASPDQQGDIAVALTIDGMRRHFTMDAATETVLSAGQRAGLELPFSCEAGMCCTCRCKLVEGQVEMDANFSLEPWELESGYVLSCQARPTTGSIRVDFDAV